MNEPNRLRTTTRRIASPFGAFYLHVLFGPGGAPAEFGVSTPGTMHGKELGEVLASLTDALNAELGAEAPLDTQTRISD